MVLVLNQSRDPPRQLAVRDRRSERDPLELRPDAALELRSLRGQRKLEAVAIPFEVLHELIHRLEEQRVVGRGGGSLDELDRGDRSVPRLDLEGADRGVHPDLHRSSFIDCQRCMAA
jgi:hypothetical protein